MTRKRKDIQCLLIDRRLWQTVRNMWYHPLVCVGFHKTPKFKHNAAVLTLIIKEKMYISFKNYVFLVIFH